MPPPGALRLLTPPRERLLCCVEKINRSSAQRYAKPIVCIGFDYAGAGRQKRAAAEKENVCVKSIDLSILM